MLALLAYGSLAASGVPMPSQRLRRGENPPSSVVNEIRHLLEEVFAGRKMGLYFARLNTENQEEFNIQINVDKLFPVASSFKAAAVLYYFLNTPRDEWYYEQGSPMYSMAVFSNNGRTGEVLYEVAQRLGVSNPLVAFNDFLTAPEPFGWSHGLYSWTFDEFFTPTNGYVDPRYHPSKLPAEDIVLNTVNMANTLELAHVFQVFSQAEYLPRWETDEHFRESIKASIDLLSIPALEYLSPLEQAIAYTEHYSKDGTLRPVDIGTYVRNDAGIWLMPDGGSYLISYMSTAEGDTAVNAALGRVAESMRLYQQFLHPNEFHILTEPSLPTHPGEFDYGFVRRTGIPLYSAPRLDAEPVPNPVRSTSIFGTTYLMYGALLRLKVIDDVWAEIIRDDQWDEAFEWPVFLRLEDVQIIGRDRCEPIGKVTRNDKATKFILLDIYNRELILFEHTTAILRTPIIVNTVVTPRDIAVLNRSYMGRNMPNYPGVPFTCFLHGSEYLDKMGFAIHGSPWHLWSDSVRQSTVLRRLTHGCINIPDWPIKISHYNKVMRPDEFIFRWVGGFENPGKLLAYMNPSMQAVRVYSFNNIYEEIWDFVMPDSLRGAAVGWQEIIDAVQAKAIDAPDFFFS